VTDKEQLLRTLNMIREDAVADAKNLDGKPFDGRTVAEQFGNTLAMIDALAGIIAELVRATSSGEGEQ
jgi:hypothetical protein